MIGHATREAVCGCGGAVSWTRVRVLAVTSLVGPVGDDRHDRVGVGGAGQQLRHPAAPTALTSVARRLGCWGADVARGLTPAGLRRWAWTQRTGGVLILVAAALALGSLWVIAFGAPVPLRS